MEDGVNLLESLEKNLRQLVYLHRNLLNLVLEERSHLLSGNLKEIREVTISKEVLLFKIKEVEKRRVIIVDKLVEELCIPTEKDKKIGLKELLLQLSEKEQGKIPGISKSLTLLIERIRAESDENLKFSEKFLDVFGEIRNNLSSLQEKTQKSAVYGKDGNIQKRSAESGGVFLKEQEG
jgi:mRNA-degrading endonuclease YafQ of YafQ-DinJ toxin-antitoxin module